MADYRLLKTQSQIEAYPTFKRTSSAVWKAQSLQFGASHSRSTYKYKQKTGAPNEGEGNQNISIIIQK